MFSRLKKFLSKKESEIITPEVVEEPPKFSRLSTVFEKMTPEVYNGMLLRIKHLEGGLTKKFDPMELREIVDISYLVISYRIYLNPPVIKYGTSHKILELGDAKNFNDVYKWLNSDIEIRNSDLLLVPSLQLLNILSAIMKEMLKNKDGESILLFKQDLDFLHTLNDEKFKVISLEEHVASTKLSNIEQEYILQ